MSDNPTGAPSQSKRFLAYCIASVSWTVLIVLLLILFRAEMMVTLWAALLVLVLVKGFGEALYIGGQASLDSYVRLAQIAADSGVRLEHKDLTLHAKGEEPPAP